MPLLYLGHCLFEVGNDVVAILDSYAEADEVRSNASFHELFVRHLAMSVACRVEDTCASVGNMGYDAYEVEIVHELDCIFARAFKAECDNSAASVWKVLLCKCVIFVVFQSTVVYPSNLFVLFEPFSHLLCVFAVARHTEMKGFKTEIEKETVLW